MPYGNEIANNSDEPVSNTALKKLPEEEDDSEITEFSMKQRGTEI